MRDKNGKESTIVRWVDSHDQQQIVSFFSLLLQTSPSNSSLDLGYESR